MAKQMREPTLLDLLNDPIAEILMKRDGVDRNDLWRLLNNVKICIRKRKKYEQRQDLAA